METEEYSKKYYKIKDVADMLGVSQAALRYWEQEFKECAPVRSSTGRRYYRPADIETLRKIHYLLKVRGLRIEAAKEQMRVNPKNVSKRVEVVGKLCQLRDELQMLLKSLEKRR